MNKILAAASLAISLAAGAGTALAANVGETIPAPLNGPVVTLAAPIVAGEAYPAFGAPQAPVISEQVARNTAGESYPNFAPPRSATRFAQAQLGRADD